MRPLIVRAPPATRTFASRFVPPETRQTLILVLWTILTGCVIIGSLAPATSPLMAAAGRLRINDKVLHFFAYLALSFLPVIGFAESRRGLLAGASMFLLGIFMEAGQHFVPGRAVEFGDVLADAAGIACGLLLAARSRTRSPSPGTLAGET